MSDGHKWREMLLTSNSKAKNDKLVSWCFETSQPQGVISLSGQTLYNNKFVFFLHCITTNSVFFLQSRLWKFYVKGLDNSLRVFGMKYSWKDRYTETRHKKRVKGAEQLGLNTPGVRSLKWGPKMTRIQTCIIIKCNLHIWMIWIYLWTNITISHKYKS